MEMYNYAVHYGLCCYCSLVIFREVFFVTTGHRKPENLGAKSCKSMILCIAERVAGHEVNSNIGLTEAERQLT